MFTWMSTRAFIISIKRQFWIENFSQHSSTFWESISKQSQNILKFLNNELLHRYLLLNSTCYTTTTDLIISKLYPCIAFASSPYLVIVIHMEWSNSIIVSYVRKVVRFHWLGKLSVHLCDSNLPKVHKCCVCLIPVFTIRLFFLFCTYNMGDRSMESRACVWSARNEGGLRFKRGDHFQNTFQMFGSVCWCAVCILVTFTENCVRWVIQALLLLLHGLDRVTCSTCVIIFNAFNLAALCYCIVV